MGNKYRLEIKAKIVDMLKSVKQKRISKYIVLFMGFLVLLQAAPVFSVGLTCHSIDKLNIISDKKSEIITCKYKSPVFISH